MREVVVSNARSDTARCSTTEDQGAQRRHTNTATVFSFWKWGWKWRPRLNIQKRFAPCQSDYTQCFS